MRSVKPSVAISTVRAALPSSSALVATVMPCAKRSTSPASAPARGALARGGAALQRLPVDVVAVQRQRREVLLGRVDVALDDLARLPLRGHREEDADLAEERPRRFGEVMTVGRKPLDRGLAGAKHLRVVRVTGDN